MQRKNILKSLFLLIVLVAVLGISYVFVSSWSPTENVKSDSEVRIDISNIPESGSLTVDYLWYKAFIVRKNNFLVFLVGEFK